MKVTGIDVGRENTGYATWDIENKQIHRHTTIRLPLADTRKTKSYNPIYYRLSLMDSMLEALIVADEPILAVVEDYIYGTRGVTPEDVENMDRDPLKLAEMHGVICSCIARCGVPLVKVSPTSMKLIMTGKGNTDKRKMIQAVYNTFKVSMPDEHQYDALCAAHIGRLYLLYINRPAHPIFLKDPVVERACNHLYMDKRYEGVAEEIRNRINAISEVVEKD